MSTLTTIAGPSSFLPVITHKERARVSHFLPALREVGISRRDAALKHIAQCGRLTGIRPAARLEARPRPEMISSGIPELDALTESIPRSCLTEICGNPSSGKTSVLLATLAAATQRGESCVLIDASNSFDPGSGAAAGIDFQKFLWVRCGEKPPSAVRGSSSAKNQSSVTDRASVENQQHRVSHPTRFSLGGDFSNDVRRTTYDEFADDRQPMTNDGFSARLEQVLKSTDLILQSGGFGLVALDLAGIPEKFVGRIPLASWFRFQRAVEHTKTALLLISEIPCAQTCAAVVVKVCNQASGFTRQISRTPSHTEIFEELQIEAEIVRSRSERKSMQSMKTNFTTQAVRAG